MKIKKALALVFGIAALVITGFHIFRLINLSWGWRLFNGIFYWPLNFYFLIIRPQMLLRLQPLGYGFLAIHISAVTLSVVLANSSKRSGLDWGISGFLFPYLSPTLLVFLKEKPSREPGLVRRFFKSLSEAMSSGSGGMSISKSCSRCGKPVSQSARAGQRCPHCGAYWSDERTIQK